jgi:hypothetical protein
MKNLINIFEFDFFAAEADFSLGRMRIVKNES